MAWKVKLVSMSNVGNGSVDCRVEFYDAPTERSFFRDYNLQMQSFPNLATIQAHMTNECTLLDGFDAVISEFGAFLGNDII
jgi:hypothetical protein